VRGRRRPWSRAPWARFSPASVLGRLRADGPALLLTLLVVALSASVATIVPHRIADATDQSVSHAVATAGDAGVVRAGREIESTWSDRDLRVDLGASLGETARALDASLEPRLAAALTEPVATVATTALIPADPVCGGPCSVRMWYFGAGGPDVTWIAGGPGPATVTGDEARTWDEGTPWPVAAGLAADTASALGVEVGDLITLRNENRSAFVDLVVSGIFEPVDPADAAWSDSPALLRPREVGSGLTSRLQIAALLSDESVPVAVRALPVGSAQATITLAPVAAAFGADNAPELAAEVAGLKARAAEDQAAAGYYGTATAIRTELDAVLTAATQRTRAGMAQAWLLLAGVLIALGLTLLLAARLLLVRRLDVLVTCRARGASAAALAGELGAESLLVAVTGAALGVVAAARLDPGPVPWAWVLPVVVVAWLSPPLLAVWHVVRRTAARPRAANRHDRRILERDRLAARVVVEAAVLLGAVGAVAALRARRVGPEGPDALVALAPALVAVALGAAAVRFVPLVLRWTLQAARRSRTAVRLLAAARSHATGTATLPFVTLTAASALAGLGVTVAATVVAGQETASWSAVGADALVRAEPDVALTDVADRLDSAPDVAAVAGVVDEAQVFGGWGTSLVRVVALPASRYAEVLAAGPLPGEPGLELLGHGDGVPILVSEGLDVSESRSLLWNDVLVDVRGVGVAPELFGPGDVVVVDIDRFAAVTGTEPVPDRVWLSGPGTASAVAGTPELSRSDVQLRAQWLATMRAEPLTVAVLTLARGAAALLAVIVVLAVALATTASRPQRTTTLATLTALGLDRRGARRVSAGELLPPVVIAGIAGIGGALLLGALVLSPLGLRLVTAQPQDPRVVVPGWVVGPPVLAVVTVLALVAAESLAPGRARAAAALRSGR